MPLSAISPSGVATAFLYPRQTVSNGMLSWATSGQVDPGNTNRPIIFEPPAELTNGELLVWIIATGMSPDWAGCGVYVSLDNATYASIGTILAGGIQGIVSAPFASGSDPDLTDTLSVDLTQSQSQLLPATQQDADDFVSLCYCASDAGGGELIAYTGASLTSAFLYDLGSYIRRGCYGTTIASHGVGSSFGRIVATTFSQKFQSNLIGRTLYFKFPALNSYGALQDLSLASAYPYTLTGSGGQAAYPWYQSFSVGGKFGELVKDEWDNHFEIFDVQMPVAIGFAANFAGSPPPGCEVAPGADVTLTFQSVTPAGTATTVGTLTITSGQKTGSYSCAAFTVARGNRLRLYAPLSVDAAIVGLFGTIVGARASFTPVPVVTVTQVRGGFAIPDTTPVGTVLATFAVVMSDGSPFIGTVAFGAPYFDDGGIFSISGSSIEINPSGPGIANTNITTVDQFTLVATQS
jgi:hypothetical protein